jgi:hypothetical protein
MVPNFKQKVLNLFEKPEKFIALFAGKFISQSFIS